MLEFMDGFDHYSQNATVGTKWDITSSGFNQVAGRFGGYAADVGQNSTLTKTLVSSTYRVVGFAYRLQVSAPNGLCGFSNSGTNQIYLRTNSTYQIVVVNGSGTVLFTCSFSLTRNTWCYIQFKVGNFSTTTGSFELRVTIGGATTSWTNGLISNVNTDPSGIGSSNQVWIAQGKPGDLDAYFDDLYVLNSMGTLNVDFLGECRVLTSLPNSNGATNTWTRSGGSSNFSMVNENPPDGDTTCNLSSTPAQIDLYAYPAIAPTGSIAGLQVNLCERKDDVGSRTTCAEYRSSGGTNYDGAIQFSPGSQYAVDRQVYETDPATSAAWTTAGVNGGQFGIKLVA